MSVLSRLFARLPFDRFLWLLLGTVALASLWPARGAAQPWVDHGVSLAISLLFLLYGARLGPAAIAAGLRHWRLQGLAVAATYGFFPLVGLLVGLLLRHVA